MEPIIKRVTVVPKPGLLIKDRRKNKMPVPSNKLNNLQAGIRVGYELSVGKIGLPMEMGAYVFTKTTINGPLYHRIGVRYYANKHLIINYSLKTHWATAESLEFGLGWKF